MNLGLIGYGTIARGLVGILKREDMTLSKVTALSLPEHAAATASALASDVGARGHVVTDAQDLILDKPDLVVECAGHAAVKQNVISILQAGVETVVVSIGALADDALFTALVQAAKSGGTRFVLPAGAIGGIDLLSALRASGITDVSYSGRKNPKAWTGTPAEDLVDLSSLTNETVIFNGNAREAATQYPKNANVAATLAFAGLGWDDTRVRLIADPGVTRNVHEFSVTAGGADFSIRIEGHPAPGNPKTSITTVYSVAREVLNRQRAVAI